MVLTPLPWQPQANCVQRGGWR